MQRREDDLQLQKNAEFDFVDLKLLQLQPSVLKHQKVYERKLVQLGDDQIYWAHEKKWSNKTYFLATIVAISSTLAKFKG